MRIIFLLSLYALLSASVCVGVWHVCLSIYIYMYAKNDFG